MTTELYTTVHERSLILAVGLRLSRVSTPSSLSLSPLSCSISLSQRTFSFRERERKDVLFFLYLVRLISLSREIDKEQFWAVSVSSLSTRLISRGDVVCLSLRH